MIYPIGRVMVATAGHFHVHISQLQSRDVHPTCVLARHVGMFLARVHCRSSFFEIGRAFGGRNHSTAMYAIQKVTTLKDVDTGIADAIQRIETVLKEGAAA